jgi:hypothetical protein
MPYFTPELSCTDSSTDFSIFSTVGSSDATLEHGPYLSYPPAASQSIQTLTRAVRRGRTICHRPSPPSATIRMREPLRRPSATPRARRRPPHHSPAQKAVHAPSPTRSRFCPRRRIPAVRCRLGSPATTGGVRKLKSSFHSRISSIFTLW